MKKRLFIASVLFTMLLTIVFLARISFSHGAPVEKANWYTDYTYKLDNTNNTITVTKYNGTDTEIILPNTATISGKTYQTIVQGGVYNGNTNLKTIIFKNGVKAGTSLSELFRGCTNLTTLTLNNFDTSATTAMNQMFRDCSSLTSLDVSKLNTSNVTVMTSMFNGLKSIKTLNVSNFNTSKTEVMWAVFANNDNLTTITGLENWDTSKATNMQTMFYNNPKLTSLNLSNFNTKEVTNMSSMFKGCGSLTSLDLSKFNTAKVTTMADMFYNCSSLQNVNLSSFNTAKVTTMADMFNNCSSLQNVNLSSFNTANVTNMSYMFHNCSSLQNVDLSKFNTANVTNMSHMFKNCSSLTSLDLSKFNTAKVTTMLQMFFNCSSLQNVNLSSFNTSNITDMSYMFNNCSSLQGVNLSSFDTSNVTTMQNMFSYCSSLTSLDLSSFNTSNVTNMRDMISNVSHLKELDISSFEITSATDITSMISNAPLTLIKLGSNTNLHSGEQTGSTFGRGTWKNLDTGEVMDAIQISISAHPGTWEKISDVSVNMQPNFNVDYKIVFDDSIDGFTTNRSDIFIKQDNAIYAKIPFTATEEYSVPGKFEVIFNDAVTDVDGNKYNFKVELDNIIFYDLPGINGINEAYARIFSLKNNSIEFSAVYFRNLQDIQTETRISGLGNKDSKSYNAKFSIVDSSGTPQEGNFIFSIYDLDGGSYRDGSGAQGYGLYSEGVYLNEGFDLNTIGLSEPTLLQIINGNRITGSRSDNSTEMSEFLIKADASESKLRWTTGGGMQSQMLSYYQPYLVELEKVDNHNNFVEGVGLSLYNYENELIESWTTTNETKKMFLLPGIYTLKETTNPNTNKYTTASDITFTVNDDETITSGDQTVGKITMTNKIKKYSYVVNYYDQDGNIIHEPKTVEDIEYDTTITSSDEIIDITNWEYDRVNKDSITIKEGSNVINIYYKRPLYTLSINKVNTQGNPLEGAEFTLYKESSNNGVNIVKNTNVDTDEEFEFRINLFKTLKIREHLTLDSYIESESVVYAGIDGLVYDGDPLQGLKHISVNLTDLRYAGDSSSWMPSDDVIAELDLSDFTHLELNDMGNYSGISDYAYYYILKEDFNYYNSEVPLYIVMNEDFSQIAIRVLDLWQGDSQTSFSGNLYFDIVTGNDQYYTFTLSDDESKTIEIPEGYQYEIIEQPKDGWSLDNINGDTSLNKVEGSEKNATYVFNNKKNNTEQSFVPIANEKTVVGTGLEFNLTPGTYELKETKAPSGYKLDLNTYTVNVAEDGTITIEGKEVVQDEDNNNIYHVDMVNELMPYLPLAGGKGVIAFLITGLCLTILGTTGYFVNKKRKV